MNMIKQTFLCKFPFKFTQFSWSSSCTTNTSSSASWSNLATSRVKNLNQPPTRLPAVQTSKIDEGLLGNAGRFWINYCKKDSTLLPYESACKSVDDEFGKKNADVEEMILLRLRLRLRGAKGDHKSLTFLNTLSVSDMDVDDDDDDDDDDNNNDGNDDDASDDSSEEEGSLTRLWRALPTYIDYDDGYESEESVNSEYRPPPPPPPPYVGSPKND